MQFDTTIIHKYSIYLACASLHVWSFRSWPWKIIDWISSWHNLTVYLTQGRHSYYRSMREGASHYPYPPLHCPGGIVAIGSRYSVQSISPIFFTLMQSLVAFHASSITDAELPCPWGHLQLPWQQKAPPPGQQPVCSKLWHRCEDWPLQHLWLHECLGSYETTWALKWCKASSTNKIIPFLLMSFRTGFRLSKKSGV